MRKLWTALVGAIVMSVAVAGIAMAENTYEVPKSLIGVSADGKGSGKEPVPTKLKFGFTVGDTDNLRPQVIREYRIAAEGLQSFPKARPTCTFDEANAPIEYESACDKAVVGEGTIDNLAGAPENSTTPKVEREEKLRCDVVVTQINISSGDPAYPETVTQIEKRGGMAVRIDVDQGKNCPIPVHTALAAPFYNTKIDGIPTAELRFTVPDRLAHPGGLDNSVVKVTTTINKKKGRVKVKGEKRTVGYYSLVGRKGKKRTTRVTFIDESGDKKTATQQK
jgi:hypothetical protein